uniref:RNase III domain-containing protein n=1 Tax=Davidia involucrata TaxID=16924 RepID=A0A5B6Z5E8_DAVIN
MAEAEPQQLSNESDVDEQANYFPPELVGHFVNDSTTLYHLYLIELRRNFEYDIPIHDIVLAVRTELELDDENLIFDLEVDQGSLTVHMKYVGVVSLTSEEVPLCLRFQITLFSILVNRNLKKLKGILDAFHLRNDLAVFDYLLLPSTRSHLHQNRGIIDWKCVRSVLFPGQNLCNNHTNDCLPEGHGRRRLHTKNGSVCSCMLENSLVHTPHNGSVFCITGILDDLDGNSLKDGEAISYKQYYKRHGIELGFGRESLLNGRHIFSVENYLLRYRQQKEKERSNTSVQLPPELCYIIMSPISIATFYSFSFVPSIMHRIESLLIAVNLKKMLADDCMQKVVIPTMKVLEAITTKKCQEKFDLESLEILGDSFLKYATSQQLFKTYPNDGEGFLSAEREKIISNNALCKLGCDHKLPGFIRNDPFDPKMWIIPGDQSRNYSLDEELLFSTIKVYNRGKKEGKK